MSTELITETYRRTLGSGTRKAVMLLMADNANEDGRGIYLSKTTMAERLDISKQTVIATIDGLIKDGLLKDVGKVPMINGRGYTVEYQVIADELRKLPLIKSEQAKRDRQREVERRRGEAALPVKDFDRSKDLTPRGQAALPNPLLEPKNPQTPFAESDREPDPGDAYWRLPLERKAAEAGASRAKRMRRSERQSVETASPPAPRKPKPSTPVAAKAREDERSLTMHAALKAIIGEDAWRDCFACAAMVFDEPGATVIIADPCRRQMLEERFGNALLGAAKRAFGPNVRLVRVRVEINGALAL